MTDERPNYLRTLALLIVLALLTYFGLSYAYALEDERLFACIGDLDGVSAVRITRTARADVTPDELAALWPMRRRTHRLRPGRYSLRVSRV